MEITKKLVFHSRQGYDYSQEFGKFKVQGSKTRMFVSKEKAIEYYESLQDEAAIWIITTIP